MRITILKLFLKTMLLFIVCCERPTDLTNVDDGIPPAVPSGLRVYYASDGEIGIEWKHNSEPDLKNYNIYRRTDTLITENIAFTQRDYFLDDSLEYEETYYYRITAVDYSGKESQQTYEVSAQPVNRYNPGRPGYPEINARNWEGNKSIFTRWVKAFDTDIAGYNIYRSTEASFTADINSLISFSAAPNYNDTSSSLEINKRYYYRMRAVDRGGLISEQSDIVADEIYALPEMIYPPDNSAVRYFTHFKILALSHPARYRIILQQNQFFGELWSREFNSDIVNDTIHILFDYPYVGQSIKYYWRIVTYSTEAPNSISLLKSFEIVQ